MNSSGLFLVIEGTNESRTTSQFKLLTQRLKAEGYDVSSYSFPQHEDDSSYFIREYLKGSFGGINEIGPYTPSLFYALDRFSAAKYIAADLAAGKVVLSNTYTGFSMVQQGLNFSSIEERKGFFKWLDQLEFGMLGIPKPDLNIVLSTPMEFNERPIPNKTTHQKPDEVYQQLAATFQENFTAIDCTKNGESMSIPSLNNVIWERIQPMLGNLRKKQRAESAETASHVFAPKPADNSYIQKNENGSYSITKDGRAALSEAVTNADKDVYFFTDKISSETIAAAMARLSRRGDDMRVTLLDEFMGKAGKDRDLLKRVITAYGDDSVQQLTGIHFVIENASNLLTKKLERGRLAAYLEQSTRYIFFDQKDEYGKFKYYTPSTLSSGDTKHYNQQMDTIFEKYSLVVQKLTDYLRTNSSEPEDKRDGAWKAATRAQACDAARAVLPVATKATVGIFASGQALESLIMHLQSDELDEARTTGENLLVEARKIVPTFLERADKPDRGGAWVAYRAQTRAKLAELAKSKNLQPIKGNGDNAVSLTEYWPKNELNALPHMLYEQSTLSLDELSAVTGEWSYTEKEAAFKSYIGERLNRRHKPGRSFEVIHYNFDLICDYGIFRDLQRHRMVDAMEWQLLTPHYGYEIPKLVSDAGYDDLFEECFELSMKLYHYLFEKGYQYESQYATLLGHRMRWKLMLNAREAYHFMELRTSPQGHPGYRKLAKQMYDAIADVHPLIAEGMIFVNQGEDAELTLLAA